VRIFSIAAGCRIAAMIYSSPAPQLVQRRRSMSNARSSSRAQPRVRRPISPRRLEPERHLPCRVHLDALVRQRRSRDGSAEPLQPLVIVCFDPHRGVKAEPIDVGALPLAGCGLARHCPAQGQRPASGARAEGDAIRHRPCLQGSERTRLPYEVSISFLTAKSPIGA
jgi:hypothetical protein